MTAHKNVLIRPSRKFNEIADGRICSTSLDLTIFEQIISYPINERKQSAAPLKTCKEKRKMNILIKKRKYQSRNGIEIDQ